MPASSRTQACSVRLSAPRRSTGEVRDGPWVSCCTCAAHIVDCGDSQPHHTEGIKTTAA
jgi:hypothetical protein